MCMWAAVLREKLPGKGTASPEIVWRRTRIHSGKHFKSNRYSRIFSYLECVFLRVRGSECSDYQGYQGSGVGRR